MHRELRDNHPDEHRPWRIQLDRLPAGYDVFWVGVYCDLAEIDRREIARGDRFPGEGRAHVERDHIHDHGSYHLRIDTTAGVTDSTARTVIDAWKSAPRRGWTQDAENAPLESGEPVGAAGIEPATARV